MRKEIRKTINQTTVPISRDDSDTQNFWQELKARSFSAGGVFFALAPMADVTDPAFRQVVAKYGKPDVLWTEFVSADGLAHPEARTKLMADLSYTDSERPIVAQLFGSKEANMRVAAKLCADLGFDGIDLNMGCPDRTIEKQGAGAAMIKTPEIAVKIIRAARQGIVDSGRAIPLSVKTRIGYQKNEIETWLPVLLRENLTAITIHCRTRKEMSKVPARWEHIREAIKLRDQIAPETLIIGNGDVRDVYHGRELAQSYGADGVMIGRAIFGNPWLFAGLSNRQKFFGRSFIKEIAGKISDVRAKMLQKLFGTKDRYWLRAPGTVDPKEKLRVLIEHSRLFEALIGPSTRAGKSFAVMKKHFKAYVNGWPGAKELRIKLMDANSADDVENIIKKSIDTY